MEKLLKSIFKKLDTKISQRNIESAEEGFHFRADTEIKLLGQMSLLVNKEVSALIELNATYDVDTYIKAEYWVEKKFEELLQEKNFFLDKDSKLIWMPKETKYLPFFKGKHLEVFIADPLYCLASKAVKAKEKNKQLIIQALFEYGEELEALIKKYDGDLDYFYE